MLCFGPSALSAISVVQLQPIQILLTTDDADQRRCSNLGRPCICGLFSHARAQSCKGPSGAATCPLLTAHYSNCWSGDAPVAGMDGNGFSFAPLREKGSGRYTTNPRKWLTQRRRDAKNTETENRPTFATCLSCPLLTHRLRQPAAVGGLERIRTSLTYVRLNVRSRYDLHSRHPSSFQALSACRRHRRFARPRPNYRQAQQCDFGGRRRLAEHPGDALPFVDSRNARIDPEGIAGAVEQVQD